MLLAVAHAAHLSPANRGLAYCHPASWYGPSTTGLRYHCLQVQHIVLKGLAQGPAASTAAGLWSPDVWTILGWAFRRSSDKSVSLSACTMELPPQEFDALKQQVLTVGGQIILKLAGVCGCGSTGHAIPTVGCVVSAAWPLAGTAEW